jgi:hypothetical protein
MLGATSASFIIQKTLVNYQKWFVLTVKSYGLNPFVNSHLAIFLSVVDGDGHSAPWYALAFKHLPSRMLKNSDKIFFRYLFFVIAFVKS